MSSRRRRFPPRSSLLAGGLAVAVAASVIAGCEEEQPPSGDVVRGLLILSGDVGRTRLTIHDPTRGDASTVDPPDPATAWISGAPGGAVVATLADGRLALRSGDDASQWRFVAPAADEGPPGSLLFASASPDGTRAAALTLAAAGQFGVTVVDLVEGRAVTFPVAGEPILAAPAWFDPERIGFVVADAELGGSVAIADVGAGDIVGGPGDARAIAASADGSAVAWVAATDGRLRASAAASWLAGQDVAAFLVEAPSGAIAGSFAMDAAGDRLAVVWEADDGQVVEITVHARTADGWPVAGRFGPPDGDPRAVVTWLR